MSTKNLSKKLATSKINDDVVRFVDERINYAKNKDRVPLPDLIEVQKNSYQWFLTEGIKELLNEVSPIADFSGKKIELHFLEHYFEPPKYDARTALEKNITYDGSLKAKVQLINKETGEIKEQDVFLGPIPSMTEDGTFIINGNTRVVVNQIVRSPGVFFTRNPSLPFHFNAKIIPSRGCWLEIEREKKGVISVKIDRKRKIPVTSLLRFFGYETDEDILNLFKGLTKDPENDFILKTLQKDSAKTVDEALIAVHRRIRPGDLANPENARALIEGMFFDYKKYDLGKVARYKINKKFNLKTPNIKKYHSFQVSDFIEVLKELIRLNNGQGEADDIDHLSNRRVRAVGELAQLKFRVGLARTVRIAIDRATVMDLSQVTPNQLINSRPITAAMREFWANSQMSQFMDQTNPLAALSHKRRLSAMGPGGLSRERASFEVRDVHPTHYGRICPIETPEGPNIGLVGHMASYARIDEYGFLQTPYRKVAHSVKNNSNELTGRVIDEDITDPKTKKIIIKKAELITEKIAFEIEKIKDRKEIQVCPYVTDEFQYYGADEEAALTIAQAGTKLNEKMEMIELHIAAREGAEAISVPRDLITHMDASLIQIISIAAALITMGGHTDPVRLTMGSNMERQAVSLMKPRAPLVGTGMEKVVALSSGHVIYAKDDGVVLSCDASTITVLYDNGEKVTYYLQVYERSNQATCIHQKLNKHLKPGIKFEKATILADGPSIENGELALGTNLLVAYMSWEGYNFEDAIILSSRLVEDGDFDSIHIEDYAIDVRDTKLGPETVTRDIPNVSEAKLSQLDEDGVIRVGASVYPGDILVGKITPKGETELTAEERLLRAIFGEKARDVKDSSLRLPGGTMGKVVRMQTFNRKDGDELPTGVIKQIRVHVAQRRQISVGDKLAGRYGNKGVVSIIVAKEDMPYLPDGTPIDVILNPLGVTSRMNIGQALETHLGWAAKKLNIKIATPSINGIEPHEIQELLKKAGLPEDGKVTLYDGRTGMAFDHKISVGYAVIMKLNHLVEDKIHARSVGPYSLVTQQPLGGKAQSGGQRFGEMEVWALEAYGAAYTLQEMLTIKSDDVTGRTNAYEGIIKGTEIKAPTIPESFNVLIRELQSLGLNVELLNLSEEEKLSFNENTLDDEMAVDFSSRLEKDYDLDEIAKIEEKEEEKLSKKVIPDNDEESTSTVDTIDSDESEEDPEGETEEDPELEVVDETIDVPELDPKDEFLEIDEPSDEELEELSKTDPLA